MVYLGCKIHISRERRRQVEGRGEKKLPRTRKLLDDDDDELIEQIEFNSPGRLQHVCPERRVSRRDAKKKKKARRPWEHSAWPTLSVKGGVNQPASQRVSPCLFQRTQVAAIIRHFQNTGNAAAFWPLVVLQHGMYFLVALPRDHDEHPIFLRTFFFLDYLMFCCIYLVKNN